MYSAWVHVRGAKGWTMSGCGCRVSDLPAKDLGGGGILMLDVSSSPYGRLVSVRHNLALMQSSDFISMLFNRCFRSLMNLFGMTSPQLNTVPFILIVCLQSRNQFSIPVLCTVPSQVFLN